MIKIEKEYYLTPSCRYFISSGSDVSWNLPLCVELDQPFDEAKMRKAIDKLTAENDVMRCRVSNKNGSGEYTVLIADKADIDFTVQDRSGKSYEEAYADSVEDAKAFTAEKIDIFSSPPVRIRCYLISAESFLICMVVHHYVADAVGVAALGTGLIGCYLGKDIHSSDNTKQFGYYLEKCGEILVTEEYKKQADYWRNAMNGLEITVSISKSLVSPLSVDHQFVISRDMLYELARNNRTTIFNVVMTALSVLYADMYGSIDTAVGFISSDRRDGMFSSSTGNYTRMLTARLTWDKNDSYRSALRKMVGITNEAVENSAAGDNLYSLPIYVSYIDERQTRRMSSSSDIRFIGIPIPHPTDCLMLACIEKSDEVNIGITANAECYTDDKISETGIKLLEILRNMVLFPDRKLCDFLPEAVFSGNDTELIMI